MPVLTRAIVQRLARAHEEGRALHSVMRERPWKIVAVRMNEVDSVIFSSDDTRKFNEASAEIVAEWERLQKGIGVR